MRHSQAKSSATPRARYERAPMKESNVRRKSQPTHINNRDVGTVFLILGSPGRWRSDGHRGKAHVRALAWIAGSPEYAEASNYVNAPTVRDRALITASGLADVEFARELFEELEVLSPNDRSLWARTFREARVSEGIA